jgi:short subunit dehydrogenase-like uncharacterized protein
MDRSYDLVVFGATGFTGRLVVRYLAQHAPSSVRWAVGGRDRARLEAMAAEVRASHGREVGVVVARSDDRVSLDALTSSTRVVLTTVGPYALHGEPLVASAVEQGADYVDITGETDFVARMVERYGARAEERGVRIVSCCGFESVPIDLGVFFAMRELDTSGPVTVEGYVQAGGSISGGTWASIVSGMGRLAEVAREAKLRPRARPLDGRRVRAAKVELKRVDEVSGWVMPLPMVDPQVVLRTAAVLPMYGNDFRYGHYVRVGSLDKAVGLALGVGTLTAVAQLRAARKLLLRALPQGEGPSDEQRARGYFRVTFVADSERERLVTRVSGGEPGYTETAKMVSECALSLVVDRERLPPRTGVLTPVLAFGEVLLDRLVRAGLRFEIVRRGPRKQG